MSDQVDHVDEAEHYVRLQFGLRQPFARVLKIEDDFNKLVSAVTGEVVGDVPADVDWILASASTNGVVLLNLTPQVHGDDTVSPETERQMSTRIVDAVVDGFVSLEQTDDALPDFFNDEALDAAVDLARAGQDVRDLGIRNGHRQTALTDRTAFNAKALLAPLYRDFGTIEGTIESINVHKDRYFRLYESLTGRGVRCNFGHRIDLQHLTSLVERRVAVRGLISYNRSGQAGLMRAETVNAFPSEDQLPRLSDMRGMFEE